MPGTDCMLSDIAVITALYPSFSGLHCNYSIFLEAVGLPLNYFVLQDIHCIFLLLARFKVLS